MTRFVVMARTALALGLLNIGRAVAYRLGVTLGLNSVRRLQAGVPLGPFFVSGSGQAVVGATLDACEKSVCLFSRWSVPVNEAAPDWLANPFSGERAAGIDQPWWKIPDFDPESGDIKLVWELSRMDWVLALAQAARQGDSNALAKLNNWLADWCLKNPPYRGPNWKCGQEASIRVMHLAMTALILDQVKQPLQGVRDFISVHLARIAPTVQYAMAQDNNHGTSEAAALFIGGNWLAALGDSRGRCWAKTGRRWLENRAARLIGEQGSFSQYSLNYHRVMLDAFCMVEIWRQRMNLPAFSDRWYKRTVASSEWLRHMINPINGDGPNVGANDGARLLQLTSTAYRDYRPTVQLAMALFTARRAYASGPWDDALRWLGVTMPDEAASEPCDYVANDGGFAVLRRGQCMVMLRYPRYKFRPSHADALHLDFWVRDQNILRDAGTYSYNTDSRLMAYFGGTVSHNTIQFDDRDQMPRLSRFLLGDWLNADFMEPLERDSTGTRFAAGYTDKQGARHCRRVCLRDKTLSVMDEVAGFTQKAVLRWRLSPDGWKATITAAGVQVACDRLHLMLEVQASVPIIRAEIVEGWESRHYLEKTSLLVLEVEIDQPGSLITELRWFV